MTRACTQGIASDVVVPPCFTNLVLQFYKSRQVVTGPANALQDTCMSVRKKD